MHISKLEKWFKKKCNGDWEHQGGILIESTDNPGWYIKVDFDNLDCPNAKALEKSSIRRTDSDFITFKYDEPNNSLGVTCGVANLTEALELLTS